ncbi:hypothetical protein [Aeromonas sp. FDAARGOS 1407]|uniref:hypothetical protein n=1 Tax=Aeromonas TaxID=642 RepID=UPI001C22BD8A|nr:hypothetical protein [Aeromonas sp. FDAARGOS 1407]QXC36168.1 hypothetical protein I6L37_11215 [Aeromonas sp. FDAARGOS 1407]
MRPSAIIMAMAMAMAIMIAPHASKAETLGVITKELANSDLFEVRLTDIPSTHPYCRNKLEAVSDIHDRNTGGVFPHSRGCWEVADSGKISVDMWTFHGADEVSLSVSEEEINLTDLGKKAFKINGQKAVVPPTNNQLKANIGNVMLAGSCSAVWDAQNLAKSDNELDFIKRLKSSIASNGKFNVGNFDDVCRNAMGKTMAMANEVDR